MEKNPSKCLYQSRWPALYYGNKLLLKKWLLKKFQGFKQHQMASQVCFMSHCGSLQHLLHAVPTWGLGIFLVLVAEQREPGGSHTHRCATLAVTQVTSSHNKWGRSHVAIPEPKTPHQSLPSFPGRRGRGKIWWTIILTPTMALEDHFYMFPIYSYKHLLLNLKFDRRADWLKNLTFTTVNMSHSTLFKFIKYQIVLICFLWDQVCHKPQNPWDYLKLSRCLSHRLQAQVKSPLLAIASTPFSCPDQ